MVNPRDIAGTQKKKNKNGKPLRYSLELRRTQKKKERGRGGGEGPARLGGIIPLS